MTEPDSQRPPPVIDSARVLAYALVVDIEYKKRGALYSGDKLIEKVPRLAICSNLGKDIGPMLFHCDDDWNVLGVSGGATVDEVKDRVERNYPGVGSRWIDANVGLEEALEYYDARGLLPHDFATLYPDQLMNCGSPPSFLSTAR